MLEYYEERRRGFSMENDWGSLYNVAQVQSATPSLLQGWVITRRLARIILELMLRERDQAITIVELNERVEALEDRIFS